MRNLKAILLLLILLGAGNASAEQATWDTSEPGSELEVALVTMGPGEIYWQRFGHNAILIQDRNAGSAVSYNFGYFDFAEKNFFLNFLRGEMRYMAVALDPTRDLDNYRLMGRWVRAQSLNLSPAQRLALRDALEFEVRPENAKYRYDYFVANCSTRVRDLLDQVLDGAIRAQSIAPSRGMSFRMHALALTAADFWLAQGIHVGLGPYADRPLPFWDEMFVPMAMMRHLRAIRVRDARGVDVPLVGNEIEWVAARLDDPDNEAPDWRWRYLGVGLVVAGLLIFLARARASRAARIAFATSAGTLAVILGSGGLLLAGLWLLTAHESAWRNENLLLFNPVMLALVPIFFGAARLSWQTRRWHRWVAGFALFLAGSAWFVKVLPWFVQANGDWIALLLPVHVALAYALTTQRSDAS